MSAQRGIKKLKTNKIPVIRLNCKLEDMKGTKSSIESQFFCNPNQDFITNGKLNKQIKDSIGNKSKQIPNRIIEQNSVVEVVDIDADDSS